MAPCVTESHSARNGSVDAKRAAAMAQALNFTDGRIVVPPDFDLMGEPEIERMFDGDAAEGEDG